MFALRSLAGLRAVIFLVLVLRFFFDLALLGSM